MVSIQESVEPNPYLAPEGRDITGSDGKAYTRINPAYMTRLVHELGVLESGVIGHITSSRPIRKGNEPDEWESAALEKLEAGLTKEVSEIETLYGWPYLRLIRPLVTETGCLSCHAVQGYKEGDVRGAISVSVPMGPITASLDRSRLMLYLTHITLWILGLIVMGYGTFRLALGVREREQVEQLFRGELRRRVELERELRTAATTDSLTGLLNRRAVLDRLDMEIARCARSNALFSLLVMDIDHFKRVNDTKGHEAGDKVLMDIAIRLKSVLRGQDALARWGGEEFLIVLAETPLEPALMVAEKLRLCVAETPVNLGADKVSVTISVGVAEYCSQKDVSFSIRRADEALYAAKAGGRNCVKKAPPFVS
jgi:diguanylate cyclase (GGDEF)-like protein